MAKCRVDKCLYLHCSSKSYGLVEIVTFKIFRVTRSISLIKFVGFVQDPESDTFRNHLTVFAESLNNVRSMIYPHVNKASKVGDILPGLAEVVEREHKKLLARKIIIEQRKEEQERQILEKVFSNIFLHIIVGEFNFFGDFMCFVCLRNVRKS